MKRNKPNLLTLVATLTFVSLVSQAAHAQTSRTWVSTSGNDANVCSKTSPCRTFSGALGKTTAGGEIDVLDSGDFSPVTITKAVSIVAEGTIGGIQASTGNAVTINAGGSDKIVLRGLKLEGLGTGSSGISFSTGGTLYVEGCTINNFSLYGIEFATSGDFASAQLVVTESVVRNNGVGSTGGGVHLNAGSARIVATIDGLRSENNTFGVRADNLAFVTIRNSLAANNTFSGFSAVTNVSAGATVRMTIENSVTTHNGTNGIVSVGEATVILSNVTVTDNQTGLAGTGGGVAEIFSFGNNRVQGNGTDGVPTQTIAQR